MAQPLLAILRKAQRNYSAKDTGPVWEEANARLKLKQGKSPGYSAYKSGHRGVSIEFQAGRLAYVHKGLARLFLAALMIKILPHFAFLLRTRHPTRKHNGKKQIRWSKSKENCTLIPTLKLFYMTNPMISFWSHIRNSRPNVALYGFPRPKFPINLIYIGTHHIFLNECVDFMGICDRGSVYC